VARITAHLMSPLSEANVPPALAACCAWRHRAESLDALPVIDRTDSARRSGAAPAGAARTSRIRTLSSAGKRLVRSTIRTVMVSLRVSRASAQ
jgi:hypothetical protein